MLGENARARFKGGNEGVNAVEFRILGPVEVLDGELVVPLGSGLRALLALLLLSANEVVSSDRLLEALWGEHPPESGAKALQVRVSLLRKALGPVGSVLVTRAPGYLLALEGEELDLSRFERLVAEADQADAPQAAVKLRQALALWRGHALADLAYESFAQPAIGRLEELRLVALEKRVEADLALGRHAELVGELEELAAVHPLRERFRAQLMLALYRCGRQADALAVYQSARRELVDELGIEPSPSLRELEQAILRQDPALDAEPDSGHRLAATGAVPETPDQAAEAGDNLPVQASSLVGRERELSELRGILSASRVLTLTGAGGVGKTRLALELAGGLLGRWRDGAWFAELAPLSDPTLVAAKVAAVLGVPEAAGRPPSESLIRASRSRELLLILDNCEHVIEAAAILADALVTQCPRVTVIATSREPLRIAGEQVYRVPSLTLPATDGSEPESMRGSEAVALFVDRARQQRADFIVDSTNAAAVAGLCRRLDGIPLAIELAAARIRALSVDEIELRLDHRFRLLTGGSRAALPRQQTLEALIDWSYNLLNPNEQKVLERLSVFAGGFDLDSAEGVASPTPDGSVLNEVTALVDKSLIQRDETTNRYRLLETVRDYAAGKLLARGPETGRAARAAHRDHYLKLAETAAPHLIRDGQLEWLDRLELELDNLRAAISECEADPNPDPGLRLVHALHYFWAYRHTRAEGVDAVCAALDRDDAQAPTLVRGRAVSAAAHLLAGIAREYDTAGAYGQEALAIAHAFSDERLRAEALCWLMGVAVYKRDEERHESLSDEALSTARALGDPYIAALVLLESSGSTRLTHRERVSVLEESLAVCRTTGNQILRVRILGNLGYCTMYVGDISTARQYLQEARRLIRGTGDSQGRALITLNLGFASYLDGDDRQARALVEEAARFARGNSDMHMLAYAQLALALLATRAGDTLRAASLHGAADATFEKLGTQAEAFEARLREADVARLRTTLGDREFELAYNAGRTAKVSDILAAA
jgi:predicted ATPase/DNA-binding SARP family transcriptional activator